MPIRIAVNSVILRRDGKNKRFLPGDKIDLTNEELASIEEVAPDSIRKPINEGGATPANVHKPGDKKKPGEDGAKSEEM